MPYKEQGGGGAGESVCCPVLLYIFLQTGAPDLPSLVTDVLNMFLHVDPQL